MEERIINHRTVQEIAALVNGTIDGDERTKIVAVAPIDQAKIGSIAFIVSPDYDRFLETTLAAAVLVRPDSPPTDRSCLIRVPNPYLAFVRIARELFSIGEPQRQGLHATAIVNPTARIGKTLSIGPYSIIEANSVLGDDCIIGNNCTIGKGVKLGNRCQIGNNVHIANGVVLGNEVIVQSGTVIGSDGFGYAKDGDTYYKIPHIGQVILEDKVEIGANVTIDRGTFGETRIKKGTKLDNLIHIAHNVVIGENTVIAAQSGISGSTEIGDNVTIAGQVGFVGHIKIGNRTIFGAQAGVTKNVPDGITVSGYPAKLHARAKKEEAVKSQGPEMLTRVRKMERFLKENFPAFHKE
ncbi:MAG: UDP-3-O-(3-hydroxymyristoyl)glucosamine N-acyltransferase [Deferribacteres bacterium]|nr:UDP-3-O-(3-hydroxymyristoyl)glucosamine N-acyltransferase [candidate division KSB1 bacterium]MCB9504151.1 UDP-3-O-(3-hydroxymyristoyl)glucosamine N-acyltransferase [Deferribacteres bacterium]